MYYNETVKQRIHEDTELFDPDTHLCYRRNPDTQKWEFFYAKDFRGVDEWITSDSMYNGEINHDKLVRVNPGRQDRQYLLQKIENANGELAILLDNVEALQCEFVNDTETARYAEDRLHNMLDKAIQLKYYFCRNEENDE